MTPTANATSFDRLRLRALALALLLFSVATLASASEILPAFSKAFSPDTIGPGSVSMLTFTIGNSATHPEGNLAFTDSLPSGLELAAPAFVSNDCGGTLTAPDGGATITFADGMVGAGATCTIVVNVTGPEPGEVPYTNISGDLTSDAGNSGPATADLTITNSLPGFTKSFDLSTVPFGGRSTLTFTIDNSANPSDVVFLDFTDNLPPGMVVADPANASTNCENPFSPATLTAVPGTPLISLTSFATGLAVLEGEATCTVTVDVIGGAVGSLGNVTSSLRTDLADAVGVGKAAAVLEVTGVEELLELAKEFTDDPVPPGGTVTLEFTVTNKSRDEAASSIAFSDDVGTALDGLAPSGPLPTDPCGAGSTLTFTPGTPPAAVLALTGGSLPPEGSCTFSVELDVPPGADPGSYSNTAGPVTGDVGGEPETGNVAGDLLFVVDFPILTKEFTDDPVGAGGVVTLEFTITNPSTSAMSAIAFVDDFDVILPTSPSGAPGSGFCNGTGTATFTPLFDFPGADPARLLIEDVGLAANGMAGDSCSFSITLDVVPGAAAGTYPNTTSEISATLDDVLGTPTVVGPPASDDIVVVGAPQLSKAFLDDPVVPGGTVTLEFTLSHDEFAPADAVGIGFTDDLAAAVPGLTAILPPSPDPPCGVGSSLTGSVGDTLLTFAGATLAPGASCVFTVSLTVPAAAVPGLKTNTTSGVTATVGGVAVTGAEAEDQFLVSGFVISKEFSPDLVIAGDTTTLEFTLDNTLGTVDASSISFGDDLDGVIAGMTAVAPLPVAPCGGTLTGTSDLSFFLGMVTASSSCSFSVTVLVPATIPDPPGPDIPTPNGVYTNSTDGESAFLGGTFVPLDPALDNLTVESTLLALKKEFTDDPVQPGGTVTLEFTLTNLSATHDITDIAFTDDLGAALSGLTATSPAVTNTCGGMATLPATFFAYSGGSLLAGTSCAITLSVDVPPGPLPGSVFPNTTGDVAGKVGTLDVFGAPASGDLLIDSLVFTKSFDGPAGPGGTAALTFTIKNLSTDPVGDLSFLDNLDAVVSGLVATGLPAGPVCGAGSVTGTSIVSLTGASLDPEGMCTFDVTVTVPGMAPAGSFLNTAGLRQGAEPVALPATALLTIVPPPTFVKVFAPDTIGEGFDTTLTFTIDNTAGTFAATGLAFLDTLPFDLRVAAVPAVVNTCGGAVVAAGLSTSVSLSGGSVAAGATCTISVQVNAPSAGSFDNTTGDLTSSSGNSGPASDTLAVLDCLAADGVNLTLGGAVVLVPESYEVCHTIEIREHYLVLGPDGELTLRAGVAVIIFNGVEFADGSTVTIEIDPSLIP